MAEPGASKGGTIAERFGLRLRIFLFFALIGAVSVAALGVVAYLVMAHPPAEAMTFALRGLIIAGFAILAAVAFVWLKFDEHVARPIERISSGIRAAVHAGSGQVPGGSTGRYLGFLAPAVAEMSSAMREARERTDAAVAVAVTDARTQKARLESVLRDLDQGVVICRTDHTVMLYNRHAHALLGTGAGFGLGRPLTRYLRVEALRHTLMRLENRFKAGRHVDHKDGLSAPLTALSVHGNAHLHGRMTLTLDTGSGTPTGYVIVFDDVSDALAAGLWRDRMLADLTADMRQRAANITMIARTLALLETADADTRRALSAMLDDEERLIAERFDRLDAVNGDLLASAWPMAPVLSLNLLELAAERRSERRDLAVAVEGQPVWLYCDSASIAELADRLLNRVAVDQGVSAFTLAARRGDDNTLVEAVVEIAWQGHAVAQERLNAWLDEPVAEDSRRMTGRDILSHHKTELWSVDDETTARIVMPLTLAREQEDRSARSRKPVAHRPEFYDFDLAGAPTSAADRSSRLSDATYVVFDTETTGLDPARGDEMIQIGAVRIVNGRILKGEVFNAFVNPGRPIPPASTKIHGITDAMVADAPRAETVLAEFRDFVGDAILVAHNAAFDMTFLAKGQVGAGVRFDDIPVLDTVLIAAHLFGAGESLTLDALAERFQVVIDERDRHTALGDALATAEVLVRLNELMAASGLATVGDALDASNAQGALRRQQKKAYS